MTPLIGTLTIGGRGCHLCVSARDLLDAKAPMAFRRKRAVRISVSPRAVGFTPSPIGSLTAKKRSLGYLLS